MFWLTFLVCILGLSAPCPAHSFTDQVLFLILFSWLNTEAVNCSRPKGLPSLTSAVDFQSPCHLTLTKVVVKRLLNKLDFRFLPWSRWELCFLCYYAGSSGNFLSMLRHNLSVPSKLLDSWTLRMGPVGCAETSVSNNHSNREEHTSWVVN